MTFTDEQRALRAQGVTGSRIAAVAGLDPYSSPYQVWCETKQIVAERTDTPAMAKGRRWEPVCLQWYAEDTGATVVSPGTLQHPTRDIVIATPDGLAIFSTGERRGVEVKMPGWRTARDWGEPGTDSVPEYYVPQVTWEAAVLGVPVVDLVTPGEGAEVARYPVRFDANLFEALVEIATRFWREHVVADVPPRPDSSERTRAWLLQQHPKATLPLVQATEEMIELAHNFARAREMAERAEQIKNEYGNRLRALLKDHAGASFHGGKITYTNNKDSTSTDWQGIVAQLNVPEHIIATHTRIAPGPRVLRVNIKDK